MRKHYLICAQTRAVPLADGHKMVLVEGIPTVFSWDTIQQYDGSRNFFYQQRSDTAAGWLEHNAVHLQRTACV
jgi:hypothetical protein